MTSNIPVWLPGISVCVVVAVVAVLISVHPRFRNRYRPRPPVPGQPTLFQKRSGTGRDVHEYRGRVALHIRRRVEGVIPGVDGGVPPPIGPPLPIGVPAVAVLAYLRPKRAVQGCEVGPTGAIDLTRGDVRIPSDPTHYRYLRVHYNSKGCAALSEHDGALSRHAAQRLDVAGQRPVPTGR